MRALGIHIFAGGFSLGVEKHFEVAAHLERGEYATKTWRRNRPGVPAYVDKTARWSQVEGLGKIDLVYGNPPCASWSSASVKTARAGDTLSVDWARDVLDVAIRVGAKITLIESVRGAYKKGAYYYRKLAEERGLSLSWMFTNTVDHGLPQNRPRVFLVFAPKTDGVFIPEWSPPVARARVLDCIAGAPDSPPLTNIKYSKSYNVTTDDIWRLVPLIPPGGSLRHHVPMEKMRELAPTVANYIEKNGWPFGNYCPTRCATDDKPTLVVFGHMTKLIHPTEDRMLTFAELMRLQGYPDDFEFCEDSVGANLTWFGKTVCPPVAEWLAGETAAYLRGDRDVLYRDEAVFDCCTDPPKDYGEPATPGPEDAMDIDKLVSQEEVARKLIATPLIGEETAKLKRSRGGARSPRVPVTDETAGSSPAGTATLVDQGWSKLSGPTELARLLISRGDDEVLAATRATFGARRDGPHMFTRTDLARLRARILKHGGDK